MSSSADAIRQEITSKTKAIETEIESIENNPLIEELDPEDVNPSTKKSFIKLSKKIQLMETRMKALLKRAKDEATQDINLKPFEKITSSTLSEMSERLKVLKTDVNNALKNIKSKENQQRETERIARGEPPTKGFVERQFDSVARDVTFSEKEDMLALIRRERDLKILAEAHAEQASKGITESSVDLAKRLGIGAVKITATAVDTALSTTVKAVSTTAMLPIVGPIKFVKFLLKKGSELNRPGRNPIFRAIGALSKLAYNLWPNSDSIAKEHPVAWGMFAGFFGVAAWGVYIAGSLGLGAVTLASVLTGAGIGIGAKTYLDTKKEYRELRDLRMDQGDAVKLKDFRVQNPQLSTELQRMVEKESVVIKKSDLNPQQTLQPVTPLASGLTQKLSSVQQGATQVLAKDDRSLPGKETAEPVTPQLRSDQSSQEIKRSSEGLSTQKPEPAPRKPLTPSGS